MNKVLLFAAIAGTMGFYACKKDDKTVTVNNTVHDTTNVTIFPTGLVNGESLSTSLTVIYGAKVADSVLPAASTDADAPVLDTTYNKVYSVIRGGFLTIYPPNVAGYVSGYYVQIVGAKSYFNINYPAAEAGRKAARTKQNNAGARGYGDGYIDSTILIKLPNTINGDTFYVRYAAYDTLNRVSKPVTAIVIVLPAANAALTDSLTGTWRYYAYKNYYNGTYDNNDWSVDTGSASSKQYYTCDNGVLSHSDTETEYNVNTYTSSYIWKYTLSNSNMIYESRSINSQLNTSTSSCSNYVYDIYYNSGDTYTGGYSYDKGSRRITFYSYYGSNINLNYDTYYLSEITSTYFVLAEQGGENGADDNYTSFYKFNKQ